MQFARIVEQNFLGLERIEHAAENIRDSVPQPVAVACLPALSTSLLPLVAQRIKQSNQIWSLLVDSGTVSEIIEKVQNLSADMALTLSISVDPRNRSGAAVHSGARLRGSGGTPLGARDSVCAADFRNETVIGWSPAGPLSFDKEAAVFADYVPNENVRLVTHTSHTRYAMVAAGLGITIAEPFAAGPWLNNGVVIRRFEPRLELSYSLCYPTGRIRSEAVSEVRKAILAAVREWRPLDEDVFTLRLEKLSGDGAGSA